MATALRIRADQIVDAQWADNGPGWAAVLLGYVTYGLCVVFAYRGRWARAKVIDRGPYAHGASWDLTQATARRIG